MHTDNKHKNMAMVTIAAVILLLANLGVWMATQKGIIEPVANKMLWGGFVALNMASILWAVTLLGLQPMVVAISYVAGGFLAFKGVEGMGGISVAEVTTAGATYGAFGALAVGNATTKVRLAFYNKAQVPFIFIIGALLVFDAALNSGISSAGGNVILNAVVFPFVLAGVIVGLVWSILIRFGIGHNPVQEPARAHNVADTAVAVEKDDSNMLKIQVPDHVVDTEEEVLTAAVAEEPAKPVAEPAPMVREAVAPAASAQKEEEFFPLEIDKDDDFVLPQSEFAAEIEEEPFSMSGLDSSLYASGAEDAAGSAMVEEPAPAVAIDLDEAEEPIAVQAEEKPKPEPQPAEEKKPEANSAKSSDWLNGHLDLLNKLK